MLRWHSGTQKRGGRTKQRDQIDNEARLFWKSILKTKHQSLTSLVFIRLVPGADRAFRHICIRCIQEARPQRGFPHRRLKYCKVLSKPHSCRTCSIEVYFGVFRIEINSDSSDEKEMILKQNSDVLVPKYIGTIDFAFHFLEQTQRVD